MQHFVSCVSRRVGNDVSKVCRHDHTLRGLAETARANTCDRREGIFQHTRLVLITLELQ